MTVDGRRPTILAVDDEPANLLLLERILRRDGHETIHTVSDPREAARTFDVHRPDIVLLDFNMPHLDGLQVMQALRKRTGTETFLPIVILTADPSAETRRRALAEGADDYLVKPLDPLEVRLRVRNLLHTRSMHLALQRERDELDARVSERTRELELAHAELLHLDRLKSDFIAMASHEMRTPLTVVKGFAEVLFRRGDSIDRDRQQQFLQTMLANADRLERLVDDLLLAAQIEAEADADRPFVLRPAHVALATLIDTALEASGIGSDDVTIDCPEATVLADPVVVERIVGNVLSNARKYGAPPIDVRCSVEAEQFHIVVRDRGTGIPSDFVDRLFDRFTQASIGDQRTATGTGLGMWIAQRLAELHGGHITYEPAEPHGARFHVSLRQLDVERDGRTA